MIFDSLSLLAILTSIIIVFLLIWNCRHDDCADTDD